MLSLLSRIKWSFRRVRIPVEETDLVLEVGSGGNPYPRSNVLLDAYEETRERFWAPLIHDRPTVISFGENLPFKDKAFDYVIAAHVLEHTPNPEKFLSELQRVAKSGYIETPDAFMERINPYKDHRLEVTVRDDVLLIRKKPSWIYDADLVELYGKRVKPIITSQTIPQNAAEFHMRYYWKDQIKYKVLNPEVDATWLPPSSEDDMQHAKISFKAKLRAALLNFLRNIFSQNSRNAKFDIFPLLRCPKCFSENIKTPSTSELLCEDCNSKYKVDRNIFQLH